MQKPQSSAQDWLVGGGEMGELIRSMDWSKTQLGPMESWPQSLRSAVSILLPSKAQIILFWGPDLIALYNDPYSPVFGRKHPWALGRPARACWSEIWDDVLGHLFKKVIETGEAFWAKDHQFFLERHGYTEETYFDVSYDPIRGESGQVGGIFCIVSETTERVLSERRLRTLRDLGSRSFETRSAEEACEISAQILQSNTADIPFALVYLLNPERTAAHLVAVSNFDRSSAAAPQQIDLSGQSPEANWPLAAVARTQQLEHITDLVQRFGAFPGGPWPESAGSALVLPFVAPGQKQVAGFLVAGVNPRRVLDEQYRDFFNLVAGHVATAVANARAYEQERKRAEALAELDRAKTTFFSNVSHEFRTPLALMLGPLDDVLAKPEGQVLPENREILTIARRNGQRLLKLVNTLLDFSRIEAGRIQAVYEPVDLAADTADLASVFGSATEKAGMRLIINCQPLPEPVYVDRDMWEKIVLNLISNAFKYTLEGQIQVSLRVEDASAILSVRDTGTGIPESELPNIFNRFHRVEGARGRTQEGTGIGLALVQELAKLHGGTVGVESIYGEGSTFTVTIPLGKEHLPPDRIGARRTLESTALGASPFVEEALRWLPTAEEESGRNGEWEKDGLLSLSPRLPVSHSRILLADDNADMRDYVRGLLGANYQVIAVADGQQALQATAQDKPDLVLADAMMPNLDGFGLLKALRENPETVSIPVIMLSARAGEESRIEGLEAGADDYLIKPFSARELLARVGGALALAKVRGEAINILRESEERMRQLTSLMPLAVYSCDEEGRITYFNRRAAELWGREPKLNANDEKYCGSFRVLGLDGSEIPHGHGPMAMAVKTGQPVRNEETMIERPDGSRIILRVNIDPLHDINGRLCGAINVFEDVTDLKQAEQASRRLAAIVESSEDAIVSKDLNGIITSWNRAAERLFGYGAEEAIGKPVTLLIPPERHDEEPAILARIRRGEPDHYETVRRRKDGSLLDISLTVSPIRDAQGNIVGASKIARDITRRKRVEVALRESEQRLRLATQTGKLGVWDWDIVTNHVSWSDSLYAIHGVRPDQFDGTVEGVAALIHPEDRRSVSEAIGHAVDNDASYELEFRAVRPDGEVIWLFTNAVVLCDGGRPVRMLGATMDITERKRGEEALRQSEENLRRQAQELEQQLIMSGRLVSLGEVTASMAHEFNNPLGIIMGFVEDMLSSFDPADPNYRALQIVDEESKRCRQIVRDLMEYARPRSTEFCSTSIADVIEKTLQLVENRLYKQKVAVEKALEPDLPRIQADSPQLEQVLVNLYLNAIDAMPEGGKLIVEAKLAQSHGMAPVAVITVADTGFGIAETDLPKIFQPFFTAKKRRGMGLGLPICQRIVKNHGGRIEVESQPGTGSKFKIYLPSEQSPQRHPGAPVTEH